MMQEAFQMPVVDISAETERQTVVDRERDQYLGHPTTVLLDDGKTIVCVYPKGHAFGQVVLKKSYDGGLTWSQRLPVPESWSTSLEVPTIFKTYDKQGKRRLLVFSGHYPIRMSYSEDDGDTWTELTPIGDYGGLVAMGEMLCTAPGEYIAFFHDEGDHCRGTNRKMQVYKSGNGADARALDTWMRRQEDGTWGPEETYGTQPAVRPYDHWQKVYEVQTAFLKTKTFTVWAVRSTDGGLTWGQPQKVAHLEDAALCEPGACFSPDKKQIAVILRDNRRRYNSLLVLSNDDGHTWSEPKPLSADLTGDRHCIRYTPDGRLFISFREIIKSSPTYGSWMGWVGNYQDLINGGVGQYRVHIKQNYLGEGGFCDCAYPGVEILPNHTIVATTYGQWTPPRLWFKEGCKNYVVSVRFTLEELDAKWAKMQNKGEELCK